MRVYLEDDPELRPDAAELLRHPDAREVAELFLAEVSALAELPPPDEIKVMIKRVGSRLRQKGPELFMPIRAAVSGRLHGPPLPEMMTLLGRERVQARMEKALRAGGGSS